MSEVKAYTVTDDEAGMRVDRWFKRRIPALSLAHLNKIVRTGQVRVDGARVKTGTRLTAGAVVRVPPLQLAATEMAGSRRPSTAGPNDRRALEDMILFEDRHLFVLNKPHGLAVQGGSGMIRHVDGMLAAMARPDGERPRLVHRLDRETSGVLLVAKTRGIAAELGEIFRSRQATKIYWALVEGIPRPARGRISLFLAKGEAMGTTRVARARQSAAPGSDRESERSSTERMRIARHGEEDAQHSVTYYAVVDKLAPRLAWLSMKPVTGRTHQLRAHAEAIGHPVIGDWKYANLPTNDSRREDPLRAVPAGLDRKLHLLARRLILPHPRGGVLDVTAPLPPHMQKSWDMFGFDENHEDPIEEAPNA
ncbi:MAG: RluA family pseudouridine synthase [Methylobacteriaceae bacterium]|nr:RluA family pseudouridine synthase [Methylobacteriaceae bacterium]